MGMAAAQPLRHARQRVGVGRGLLAQELRGRAYRRQRLDVAAGCCAGPWWAAARGSSARANRDRNNFGLGGDLGSRVASTLLANLHSPPLELVPEAQLFCAFCPRAPGATDVMGWERMRH
jgi:hypothetical protein